MNRKHLFGFAFYDFSNSAYILIFHAFLFPLFFKDVIFRSASVADFWWGFSLSFSVALAIIIGPVIGHRSDLGNKKSVFSYFVTFTFIGILLLAVLSKTPLSLYVILFIITNLFFILSQVIYDSFLPHIAPRNDAPVASGFSWGFGYIGGVCCLGLVLAVQGGSADPSKLGIYATALFYILFSVVSLRLLPKSLPTTQMVSLKESFRFAKVNKLLNLLLGIWLINEAIDIFIFFGALYARQRFQVSTQEIGIVLIGVQLIAFPATWIFGMIGRKYGVIRTIYYTIIIWLIVAIGMTMSNSKTHLVVIASLGSLVIGSTQALLRAYYSKVTNRDHSGLYFGIYSIAARSSAVIGPIIYGLTSYITGNPSIAILTVVPQFILGTVFLAKFHKQNKLT